MSELTKQERDIVNALVDAELRGDIPEGGAVRAAETMISQLRDLQEKRTTMLARVMKGRGGE